MEHILRQLVAYPTISGDRHAAHQLLSYTADYLAARGMHIARFESNGYESIVASTRPNRKTPTVLLAAHADVVPASETMFTMRSEDGKYYGRGTMDMKFAIAAYMQLVDNLKNNLGAYDFGIMITTDEELGGHDGVEKLVEEGYVPRVCILPDGGNDWQLQTVSKGMWLVDISTTGISAHGSRPWLGDNAIVKLMDVYQEIAALFPDTPGPETDTLTLAQFEGGEAINQVPDKATMSLDIRTSDSQRYQELYHQITDICHKHGANHIFTSEAAPTHYDLSDPYIQPFTKLITEVTGIQVTGHHALGSSDVRYYVPYGVPCISMYLPGANLHADNEWVSAGALEQFLVILQRYVGQVARSTPVDG